MSVVLNEHESAEAAMRNRELGQNPYETLRRVARYVIDENCYDYRNRSVVRQKLNAFLLQCNPILSLVKWDDRLDKAVDYAFAHEAICIDSIAVTEPEMQAIDALKNKSARRLAFTLLCLAKYQDIAYKRNSHWVNTTGVNIMKLANVSASVKRQCEMYAELERAGMIKFSRRIDSSDMRVLFVADGRVVVSVRDFRNLGYQYLLYHGGGFFECENCGITVKKRNHNLGRPQKYCDECASKVQTRQVVDFVLRQRKAMSGTASERVCSQQN